MTPTLGTIKRRNGAAGELVYTVDVTYPGEDPGKITFVGSVYGGPVVMITPAGTQTFVRHASDLGKFGPEWVRRFFTERG